MTDTGQVPGEGLPENAGMVEQPGVPAPGAYTYLDPSAGEEDDLLLMPGAQGAWSEHPPGFVPAAPVSIPGPPVFDGSGQYAAPEPVPGYAPAHGEQGPEGTPPAPEFAPPAFAVPAPAPEAPFTAPEPAARATGLSAVDQAVAGAAPGPQAP
ncbi:5,6-dimethylbenzimidazole synthase, partial [Streptomyces sp. NPDC001941]